MRKLKEAAQLVALMLLEAGVLAVGWLSGGFWGGLLMLIGGLGLLLAWVNLHFLLFEE